MGKKGQVEQNIPRWFAPVSVSAGLIFLVAILVAAIFIPEPSPFQVFVFRVVMALAAASFGATIPGFLKIDMPLWGKGVVAAGGALALFVIVFKINPPALDDGSWVNPNPDRHISLESNIHIGLDLPDCNSSNTDVEGFIFDNAVLSGCDFSDASLSRARFNGANVSGSNFSRTEAYGASFEEAGVVAANFTQSVLVDASFKGAELVEAQFWGARLFKVDFREANLNKTKLAGADISGADFRGATNLTQLQINSAFYDPGFEEPLRLPNGLNPPPETMHRPYLEGIAND